MNKISVTWIYAFCTFIFENIILYLLLSMQLSLFQMTGIRIAISFNCICDTCCFGVLTEFVTHVASSIDHFSRSMFASLVRFLKFKISIRIPWLNKAEITIRNSCRYVDFFKKAINWQTLQPNKESVIENYLFFIFSDIVASLAMGPDHPVRVWPACPALASGTGGVLLPRRQGDYTLGDHR